MVSPRLRRTLLAACAAAVCLILPASSAAQTAVVVVRHGEKISDDDERLTEAGRARAMRLAEMLRKSGIAAIYSTDTERTLGTVQPLASALGLKIRIYDTQPAKGNADFEKLVNRLRSEAPDGVVLVVGHSNTVPLILRALGCREEVTIASDEYDNLFVVVAGSGGATLLRLRY
jgi:broad specificity phosphatase PhoE